MNSNKSLAQEAKEQISTRAEAIKEDLKNADKKNNTGEKLKQDLTASKEEVQGATFTEKAKNAAIDGFEAVKGAVESAAESVKGFVSGFTNEAPKK